MAQTSKTSLIGVLGMTALVLSAAAVVVMLLTLAIGSVRGTEFNPQTFERRMFGFYEIPLVRLQVTPLWRQGANGDVEDLVIAEKYVSPQPQAPEEWELISLVRRNYKQPPTDVQILVRYLDANDEDSDSYWRQWSVKQPELAALLWPEVARLARLEQYVLLPPLFELARGAQDLKTFQSNLRQLQTKQLQDAADHLQHRGSQVDDKKLAEELKQRADALAAAAKAADEELSKAKPKIKSP